MGRDSENPPGLTFMLRCFFLLFLTASCSLGGINSGGEAVYLYEPQKVYSTSELKELSSKIITTSFRNPPFGKMDELFGPGQKPLKKIGIVIFESEIQPTRSGLSGANLVYLNEAGKQLITEGLHKIWEDTFSLLNPSFDYYPSKSFKKSKAFRAYGNKEKDFVLSKRNTLAPDDIFFLETGKNTTTKTVMNPRGMQDVSFVLVPAYDLMRGPKFSEHNKHFINDLSRELYFDAFIIIKSDLSWTTAHTDKHSGESLPEAIHLKLESSVLIPLHSYHDRLKKIGSKDESKVTISYRSYQSRVEIPIMFPRLKDEQTFESIQTTLILPMLKSYTDLTQMMVLRMDEDLKKTW